MFAFPYKGDQLIAWDNKLPSKQHMDCFNQVLPGIFPRMKFNHGWLDLPKESMVKFFHFPVPVLGTKKDWSESKQESMWTFFSENCNKIIVLLWLAMPFSKSSLHQKNKHDAVNYLPLNWKYQPQIHNFSQQVNHKWLPTIPQHTPQSLT